MFVSPSGSFLAYANLRCSSFSPEEGVYMAIPSDKTLLRTKLYRVAIVLTRFSAGIRVRNYNSKLNEKHLFFLNMNSSVIELQKLFTHMP